MKKPGVKKRKNTGILIMEEDHLVRELLFQVLSNKGYKVEAAESIPEGVEKLKDRPFDMVIAGTIFENPQALIDRIRRASPDVRLALIEEQDSGALSGKIRRGSVDLLIGKPIDMSRTVNRISEILCGRAK